MRSRHFRLSMTSAYGTPVQVAEAVLLRQGDEPILRRGVKWWWFKSGNRSFWDYPRQGPAALDEEYPQDGAVDYRSKDVVDLTSSTGCRRAPDVERAARPLDYSAFRIHAGGPARFAARPAIPRAATRRICSTAPASKATLNIPLCPCSRMSAASGTHVLKYLHIDSYELGADVRGQQPTWSRTFREEFKKRRGYDLLPYLPAMARRIVDSRDVTNRFLFDIRWTIGDLMAEQFWIPFGELAHAARHRNPKRNGLWHLSLSRTSMGCARGEQ